MFIFWQRNKNVHSDLLSTYWARATIFAGGKHKTIQTCVSTVVPAYASLGEEGMRLAVIW